MGDAYLAATADQAAKRHVPQNTADLAYRRFAKQFG
jgi:hypothetical protein